MASDEVDFLAARLTSPACNGRSLRTDLRWACFNRQAYSKATWASSTHREHNLIHFHITYYKR